MLVVFRGGEFADEVVATAQAVAARRRRAIHVLAFAHVPVELPLDAELGEADEEARSVIERAKLICGQRVTGEVRHVRPGQAGQAIIEQAKEIDAAVIVMPLRYRNGKPMFSKALRTVLAKRPSRVMVVARPDTVAVDGAGGEDERRRRRRGSGRRLDLRADGGSRSG